MTTLGNFITAAAEKHGLDPELVAAIVLQESAGDPLAKRLENGFYRVYLRSMERSVVHPPIPEGVPKGVELVARAASWGVMQIMGQVAREEGFANQWLSDLEDPQACLEVGCTIFKRFLDSMDGDVRKALLRWNGGADRLYGDHVLNFKASGAARKLLEGK